ncbi:hypothetical protein [Candidatus Chloroploca sp. Khr17]|uniref:hypothetical protein n=1 Tax=Candidatus Chloroploca sp. Khr17 TaxID=2496869 RepID=UPI00101C093C|nr:hypothetical protein [Candidatus Chloroploca sp. Khr17]
MSLAFPRSLRSLSRDTGRTALIGIAVAMVLLLAWVAWLILAELPIYVRSQDLALGRDGSVVARFAPEDLARIRRDQPASLIVPASHEEQAYALPARVLETPGQGSSPDDLVRLRVRGAPQPLRGEIRIEVAAVTPFELVLRGLGS